jgi:MSHA biogenesis protein MshI
VATSIFGLRTRRRIRRVGIELSNTGALLVVVDIQRKEVEHAVPLQPSEPAEGFHGDQLGQHLAQQTKRLKLKGMACTVVLAPEDCELLLLEAPQVPTNEIKQALRWRLKGLSDIAPEEAEVDYVSAGHMSANDTPMLFVGVTRKSVVARLVRFARGAKLALDSVLIPEFAVRNLLVACGERETCVGVLMIRGAHASIAFFRAADLCMSRKFATGYSARVGEPFPVGTIAAEVRRSFDYFERQLKQPTPERLFVGGDDDSVAQVALPLSGQFPLPLTLLDPARYFTSSPALNASGVVLPSLALGAALEGTLD